MGIGISNTVKSCKCNTLKLTPVKSSRKVTVLPAHLKSLELSFHFFFFSQRLQRPLRRDTFLLITQSSVHFLQLLIDSDISFWVVIAFCSFTQVHLAFYSGGYCGLTPTSNEIPHSYFFTYHPATGLGGKSKKGKIHGLRKEQFNNWNKVKL